MLLVGRLIAQEAVFGFFGSLLFFSIFVLFHWPILFRGQQFVPIFHRENFLICVSVINGFLWCYFFCWNGSILLLLCVFVLFLVIWF